ncbi:MAG: HigA family addiction module antitoxin [Thermomicrobiales bacterium]
MVRPLIHPGEILADELETLQISASQLSRELHVPVNRITRILGGRRAITADTALRLGQWLGTGPEFWLNLQKAYELRLAEQEVGAEIRRTITTLHVPSEQSGAPASSSSASIRLPA